jgi:hypothetical protein
MGNDDSQPVAVSRRIAAPAGAIFEFLADPARHPDFDGSGMLQVGAANDVVSGVGDVFVMKMHNERLGNYEMSNHVVEYEVNRSIVWEPAIRSAPEAGEADVSIGVRPGHRWGFRLVPDGADATIVTEIYDCSGAPDELRAALDNGKVWVESMTKSLEQLDQLLAETPG